MEILRSTVTETKVSRLSVSRRSAQHEGDEGPGSWVPQGSGAGQTHMRGSPGRGTAGVCRSSWEFSQVGKGRQVIDSESLGSPGGINAENTPRALAARREWGQGPPRPVRRAGGIRGPVAARDSQQRVWKVLQEGEAQTGRPLRLQQRAFAAPGSRSARMASPGGFVQTACSEQTRLVGGLRSPDGSKHEHAFL